MQGYDLYEECSAQDGSIPGYVLAFPRGEFERQRRDPRYRPVAYRTLNPRKIVARRREIQKDREISDALLTWKRSTFDPPAPDSVPPSPKDEPGGIAPSHRQTPDWSQAARPETTSRTAVKPAIVPPRPPLYVFPYPNTSAPAAPPASPPSIPEKIWQIVNEVKALTPWEATGLPKRKELKQMRFREYFFSSGQVRSDSELWNFKGDTRLFSKELWDYLTMEHLTR